MRKRRKVHPQPNDNEHMKRRVIHQESCGLPRDRRFRNLSAERHPKIVMIISVIPSDMETRIPKLVHLHVLEGP